MLDDREDLDADALIATFKDGIEYGNEQRRAIGAEEMLDINWAEEPFYDPETNNLTWTLHLDFPSSDSRGGQDRHVGQIGFVAGQRW